MNNGRKCNVFKQRIEKNVTVAKNGGKWHFFWLRMEENGTLSAKNVGKSDFSAMNGDNGIFFGKEWRKRWRKH